MIPVVLLLWLCDCFSKQWVLDTVFSFSVCFYLFSFLLVFCTSEIWSKILLLEIVGKLHSYSTASSSNWIFTLESVCSWKLYEAYKDLALQVLLLDCITSSLKEVGCRRFGGMLVQVLRAVTWRHNDTLVWGSQPLVVWELSNCGWVAGHLEVFDLCWYYH